jgi:hypothetical protein
VILFGGDVWARILDVIFGSLGFGFLGGSIFGLVSSIAYESPGFRTGQRNSRHSLQSDTIIPV